KTAEQDIGDFSDFGERTAEIERPAPCPARGHDPRRAFGTFVRHGKGCLSKISGKNAVCTFHDCDKYLQKRGIQGIGIDKQPGNAGERAKRRKVILKKDYIRGVSG